MQPVSESQGGYQCINEPPSMLMQDLDRMSACVNGFAAFNGTKALQPTYSCECDSCEVSWA
jgi:hypothetical protein